MPRPKPAAAPPAMASATAELVRSKRGRLAGMPMAAAPAAAPMRGAAWRALLEAWSWRMLLREMVFAVPSGKVMLMLESSDETKRPLVFSVESRNVMRTFEPGWILVTLAHWLGWAWARIALRSAIARSFVR